MYKWPLLLSLLLLNSYADVIIQNQPLEETYMVDHIHGYISNKVIHWSDIADTRVSSWLGYKEKNSTCNSDRTKNYQSKKIDDFFKNDRYIDETEDTYIRLRLGRHFNSREADKNKLKVNLQLPFTKCKSQLKFFVDNISLDDKEIDLDKDTPSNVGIRYTTKTNRRGIQSRYSLGFTGGSLYTQARYSILFDVNDWEIEPLQTFRYSVKDYFEEKTNIYFDRLLKDMSLFRIKLHRKTGSKIEGVDYSIKFQYYTNSKKNIGFRASQSFSGNTKYYSESKQERYRQVNEYLTTLSWRGKVWRDWLYFELGPAVKFHEKHDFKPNYEIRVLFDFYFGKYN